MGQTDLAVRLLVEHHLTSLLPVLLEGRQVDVLGVERSELKVVERLTDQVVRARVDGEETILHVEFQARHEVDVPERMLAYNALLRHRHRPLPVFSMLVYLMHAPPAVSLPSGIRQGQVNFAYELYCAWERPIGLELVRGQPALAPLAVLTPGIGARDLPVLARLIEEAPGIAPSSRRDLLALTFFIAGRRFPEDLLTCLVESSAMEESATYQRVIEKGRAEGLAAGLIQATLDVVEARLGRVPAELDQRLHMLEPEALRSLLARLLRAPSVEALRTLIASV